jgi:nucleoside-diphosphate-sugar epimerase
MESDGDKLTIRSSYNLSAMSFAPEDVAKSIQATIPSFTISYDPDFRQAIADSWPCSIDDSQARKDWGWKPEFDLKRTTKEMLENLS